MRFHVFLAGMLAACALAGPMRAQELRTSIGVAPEDWTAREHSAGVREDARNWTLEELAALEARDRAAFQDLLRRNLAARLLWITARRPLPPDLHDFVVFTERGSES